MQSLPIDPAIRKVLFDASADGLFLLEEGRVVEANATAAMMFGEESPSILVSKPLLWWLAAPSDHVRLALIGDALAVTSEPHPVQLPGEDASFQLSLLPLTEDPNGTVLARLQRLETPSAPAVPAEDSLLQLVLDSIPIGVFWKDQELRFVGCNQRFAKDAGMASPLEIVGKTDLEMPWAKEDSEAYMRDDRQVMQGDKPQAKITERQLRADGTHAWVETYKVPMHDEGGHVIGILGSYEDITERTLAEASLQSFSEGLHEMAQSTADKSGQKLFESSVESMAKLTGFSTTLIGILDERREGVVISKALWSEGKLVDGGVIDLSDSPLSESLRTKSVVRIESGVCDYHPDNQFLKDLGADAFIGLPIVFSSGEICGFFCGIDTKPQTDSLDDFKPILDLFAGRIAVELDRSWAMEALEGKIASAHLLESISTQIRESFDPDEIVQSAIARLGDGLQVDRCFILSYHLTPRPELVLTAEHTVNGVESIEDWNVKIEGSAYFEKLLLDDGLLAVESLDDEELIGGALKRVLNELNVQSMVAVRTSYQNQTNGILLLQQCHAERAWTSDEQHLVKSVADMVGIALGQARMFENERLQRHELARKNRALAKAKADADSANHAKSEFLSRMSHELRTPLNAILGFAQVMARDSMATDQQQQNLATITRSGTHLLEMINDVLEMSRIEAGEVSVEPTSFNLEEMLDSVVSMFQTRAHPGVKLKLGISPTVPVYARTDEVKLRQILINLFGNAVKFTQEGEVALRVRAEQRYPEGVCSAWNLIASIHDTGPGIHEGEVGALFQAFSQTETGQSIQQGTGLGLPISRQFARLLGGDISVQSSPGKGTIFSLKIPCGEAHPAELDDRRLAQNQRAQGLAPRQEPPKVLIVDDHQESRVWLEMLLVSIGLPAQTAVNGAEALKQCQEEVPDIIFMDIHMPVMDGDTAAKEMRKLFGEDTPVLVALTASAFIGGNDRVAEGPFDLFLPKPVHEKSLVEIFEKEIGVRFDYGNEDPEEWFLPDISRETTPSGSDAVVESEVILQPLDAVSLSEVAKEEAESNDPEESVADDRSSPTTRAIRAMPEVWQERLNQASARLNLKETRELLKAMKEAHPSEAVSLQKWCEDYQFEKLQTELKQARELSHAAS